MLRLELDPRLCAYVGTQRSFGDKPLVIADVGARGGPASWWHALRDQAHLIGFEPDVHEAERLRNSFPGAMFLPVALEARAERRTMLVTAFPAGSGFYRTGELMRGTENERNVEVVATSEVDVVPLDSLELPQIDFLKIDVELSELDVLTGAAEKQLPAVICVELEVHFPKRPADAACFAEIDAFLRAYGFELYDLEPYRFARCELPSPPLYDYRAEGGEPIPGPTLEGQILTGDALYFRTLEEAAEWESTRILKFACLLELHRLADCAVALLRRSRIHELAVLLEGERPPPPSPATGGRRHGRNYHIFEALWRRHGHDY